MSTQITCKLCGQERIMGEMITCGFRGVTTYECLDETSCKQAINVNKSVKDVKQNEYLDKIAKYKHLPQDQQFVAIYGLDFSELSELGAKFRDASVHYYYPPNGSYYSWNWSNKTWYISSFDLSQYL